jgi:lipopolysaccharide heptosyltransferase II
VDSDNIKKILVIRLSSLGDIILTEPLLRSLKKAFPRSSIHFVTKKMYADVLPFNPSVDSITEAEDNIDYHGLKELKKRITSGNYDLIIDAHNNLRTFYLKLFQKAKKLTFKKYSIRKFLLVKFKINLMKQLPPIAKRYCEIIRPITDKIEDIKPSIFTDPAASGSSVIEHLENSTAGKIIIGIVPSSNHFTKTYPAEKYIELINSFDKNKYSFCLFGKGKDKQNIDQITAGTGENVVDLCDKLNVNELAEAMKLCSLIVSGDTGPMHIAESLKIPLIMLAGSSVKEFGFYPQTGNAIVMERDGLSCRPCSHIGRSRCPKGHFKCMNDLTPAAVSAKMLTLLTIVPNGP